MIPYSILVRKPRINKIFTPNRTAFNISLIARVFLQMSLVTSRNEKLLNTAKMILNFGGV